MDIYTLNVSQGQFVVVSGKKEAFIVDSFMPLDTEQETVFVKAALSKILSGKNLIGLLVTGFDADHFCEPGMKIILNKYRPNWLMYPKYVKNTDTADRCFKAIKVLEGTKEIMRIPVLLEDNDKRCYQQGVSEEFSLEVFSPNHADMNSSNNCSIVCRVREQATRATYLVTGDTEGDRWDVMVREFGNQLKSDVLAAPHHGSENGLTAEAARLIEPHTVLVSAGVNSQYGHPHVAAKRLFELYSTEWWSTNGGMGQSLRTVADGQSVKTYKFEA